LRRCGVGGARFEVSDVTASSNGDDDGFVLPLGREVTFHAFAQLTDFYADNRILACPEIEAAPEYDLSEMLLAKLFVEALEAAVADVKEQIPQTGRVLEHGTVGNAFDQTPISIVRWAIFRQSTNSHAG
jgi:hypothetical protein